MIDVNNQDQAVTDYIKWLIYTATAYDSTGQKFDLVARLYNLRKAQAIWNAYNGKLPVQNATEKEYITLLEAAAMDTNLASSKAKLERARQYRISAGTKLDKVMTTSSGGTKSPSIQPNWIGVASAGAGMLALIVFLTRKGANK